VGAKKFETERKEEDTLFEIARVDIFSDIGQTMPYIVNGRDWYPREWLSNINIYVG
jgi:hypothetical protein